MAIFGFVVLCVVLGWSSFFCLAMIFGSLAFSGVWKSESTLGVILLIVVILGWIKLIGSSPFTVVFT